MKKQITVIIIIRNRECSRIKNQIESIRNNGANPSFIIVDYGSDEQYAQEYELCCKELGLSYCKTYSQGTPWNRSKAINIGVKQAKTPFIVVSDADMIYTSNPFQWCLDNFKENNIYHMDTYWLDQNADFSKTVFAGHGNAGGFVFSSKKAFEVTGGYDERYQFWGMEDIDFQQRLKLAGWHQVWLPENFKLYHVWHPRFPESPDYPFTAPVRSVGVFLDNICNLSAKQDWGKNITLKQRPILSAIKNQKPVVIDFSDRDFTAWYIWMTFIPQKKKGLYFLKFNPNKNQGLIQKLKENLKKIYKPHDSTVRTVAGSFGTIYEILPVLQKNGLKDYYALNDASGIYLLW